VNYKTNTYFSLLVTVLLLSATVQTFAQEVDHTYTSEAVQTGNRIYVLQCALCHGLNGTWMAPINLSLGQFRTAHTDDDLRRVISDGAGEGRMPPANLNQKDLDAVIAFIRVGFEPDGADVQLGDAERGKKLYEGKGKCTDCHRINGQGPRTAPDLSDIGLIRTPAALQRSLLDPITALLPLNRPITIVTREKERIVGRRLNEDTYTVQLIDSKERLRSFVKADLVSYEISDTATHQPTTLSSEEVADLLAYLLTLKGPQ
jgi:putative heme-binding domain-containing protein